MPVICQKKLVQVHLVKCSEQFYKVDLTIFFKKKNVEKRAPENLGTCPADLVS